MGEKQIEFLKSTLETNMQLNDIAHESADFLAGLSGVIMAVSLTQIFTATGFHKIGFGIISLTGFIVIFFSIGVMRPKIGMKKLNMMYYKGLLGFPRDRYAKEMYAVIKSDKKIVETFCDEIYDLSIELRAKYKMIRRGADILAAGLIIGIIFIFLS